ncbi:gas vesicle protein [Streptomyces maoxianensis]|uniref:Gas vesicle protein n=1 Tax=Streptomyces maoxianensis TaxID=1459942 RepID=A0ABV9G3D3_9ACTN|nr:gas vesicle protein [Streptomyces sp. ISL-1]MBT2393252.1 gas vesicle protein [Streptomyces sp. ISL-1]
MANSSENTAKKNESATEKLSLMEVARRARAQLAELTGMEPDSVSSFTETDDGWSLEVQVLELRRIPDTTSLLASYEVTLDSQGEMTGYRRIRRYVRSRADS